MRQGLAAGLATLVLTGVTGAQVARAQNFASEAELVEGAGPRFKSPQRFGAEVTFGPYRPNVDGEFNGTRDPYKAYFGTGQELMMRAALEYQFWHRYGTLAGGLGVGYFSVTGTAPVADGSGLPSGDQSTLTVIPFNVSAIYRFDYFLEQAKFPLVPFGKIGLDYAYWSITDGNGNIAVDSTGGRARGGTLGWHVGAGAAFVIDFLDPDAAHDFDEDLGVNHTAITFEYYHADISGLGQANRLHVGDSNWTLGLLLEF
jgi:hypothetical protein